MPARQARRAQFVRRNLLRSVCVTLMLTGLTALAFAAPPVGTFHVPVPPPSPNAPAQDFSSLMSRAPFVGNKNAARGGPAWAGRHAAVATGSVLAQFTLNSIGPSQILGGQDPGGGPVSGRIAAIAVDPTDNSTFYIAAAGGGVWKTNDNGSSFTVLTDNLPDIAMGALAVDPNNHNTIYAGSGEANFSIDSRYGAGVYKSTDGGQTWAQYTGPNGAFAGNCISRIVVDPVNSNNVFLGTTFGIDANGFGVYKSTDGGQTWAYVFAPDASAQQSSCTDLAINPSNPQIVYAAIGDLFGGYDYNNLNGIWKTTDGGTTWTLLSNFPNASTNSNVGRIALTLAPSSPSTLYANDCSAAYFSNAFGTLLGTYKSTDAGATWTKLTTPNYLGNQGWYDDILAVSPTDANVVFAAGQINYGAGGTNGIVGSHDGGATWSDYSNVNGNGPHTDHHALAYTINGQLLNGNDGGLWELADPTVSTPINWTDLNTNLTITQFTGIGLHPTDPTIAYGGSQDNGTEKYTGTDVWNLVRGGDGGFVAVDQTNANTVYHEYYGISLERSDNGGQTWNGKTSGIGENDPALDGSDPAAFYVPYILDPLNQSRVIYGTNHVYESTNRGDNFTAIATPGTNGYTAGTNDTISALGAAGATIYSAANGSLYVTTNDGASWTKAAAVPGGGPLSGIYVDPATPATAIVTRASFGGGHVFRTINGGATWTDISGNLPNEPFQAITRDAGSNTLYAGADNGAYFSYNTGATWTKAVMPNVQVVSIAVSPGATSTSAPYGIVGAGSHGRGMFEAALPPYASTTTLMASPNPAMPGQDVTLTATVTSIGSNTGTVQFKDSITNLGSPVAVTGGTASLHISTLMSGDHSLTAVYSGDAATLTSTSDTFKLTVSVPDSLNGQGVDISPTALTAFSGNVATFTDSNTVTDASAFSASVDWGDSTTATTGTVSGSAGSFSVSGTHTYTLPGQYTVTTTITGLGGPLVLTSTATVGVAATTTMLTSSLNPSVYGQKVTFTATVTGPGNTTPAEGFVQFRDTTTNIDLGGSAIGSSTVSVGVSLSSLNVGSHMITATYTDSNGVYSGSMDMLTQVVNNPAPTIIKQVGDPIPAGSPGFSQLINGTGFLPSSVVSFDGTARATKFVSATQMRTFVAGSELKTARKIAVVVTNPAPGGGTSNTGELLVTATRLKVTAGTPTSDGNGGYLVPVTVTNTGYATAVNTRLLSATLGGANTTTPLPVKFGTLTTGQSVQKTLAFPASAGTSGQHVMLKVSETYQGDPYHFVGSLTVTLP